MFHLGSQADVAISIFGRVSFATSTGCSKSDDSEELCAGASSSLTRFSLNTVNHSRRSANGSSSLFLSSLFLCWFWIFTDSSPSHLVACSSLRSNTEPEDELEAALFPEACSASLLNESCGVDVED